MSFRSLSVLFNSNDCRNNFVREGEDADPVEVEVVGTSLQLLQPQPTLLFVLSPRGVNQSRLRLILVCLLCVGNSEGGTGRALRTTGLTDLQIFQHENPRQNARFRRQFTHKCAWNIETRNWDAYQIISTPGKEKVFKSTAYQMRTAHAVGLTNPRPNERKDEGSSSVALRSSMSQHLTPQAEDSCVRERRPT